MKTIKMHDELAEKLNDALKAVYEHRYEHATDVDDEYWRGYGKAIEDTLEFIGADKTVEWNPLKVIERAMRR